MSGKIGISGKAGMSGQAGKSGMTGKLARCSVGLPSGRLAFSGANRSILHYSSFCSGIMRADFCTMLLADLH